MARIARVFGRARGRGLERHAAHHRLARHLVDHPDLDGVGRRDRRRWRPPRRPRAAPPAVRDRRASRRRAALRRPPSTISVSKPAEVSSPFRRTRVSTMTGGEFAGRTIDHAGRARGRRPEEPGRHEDGERESAHARCRLGGAHERPRRARVGAGRENAGDTPPRPGAPAKPPPACSSGSSCVPAPPTRRCPPAPASGTHRTIRSPAPARGRSLPRRGRAGTPRRASAANPGKRRRSASSASRASSMRRR